MDSFLRREDYPRDSITLRKTSLSMSCNITGNNSRMEFAVGFSSIKRFIFYMYPGADKGFIKDCRLLNQVYQSWVEVDFQRILLLSDITRFLTRVVRLTLLNFTAGEKEVLLFKKAFISGTNLEYVRFIFGTNFSPSNCEKLANISADIVNGGVRVFGERERVYRFFSDSSSESLSSFETFIPSSDNLACIKMMMVNEKSRLRMWKNEMLGTRDSDYMITSYRGIRLLITSLYQSSKDKENENWEQIHGWSRLQEKFPTRFLGKHWSNLK